VIIIEERKRGGVRVREKTRDRKEEKKNSKEERSKKEVLQRTVERSKDK
jgi:hypothetical protein